MPAINNFEESPPPPKKGQKNKIGMSSQVVLELPSVTRCTRHFSLPFFTSFISECKFLTPLFPFAFLSFSLLSFEEKEKKKDARPKFKKYSRNTGMLVMHRYARRELASKPSLKKVILEKCSSAAYFTRLFFFHSQTFESMCVAVF